MDAQTPIVSIGGTVLFGDAPWTVVKFHKVGGHWEVLFRSADDIHRSIDCRQIERFVGG